MDNNELLFFSKSLLDVDFENNYELLKTTMDSEKTERVGFEPTVPA